MLFKILMDFRLQLLLLSELDVWHFGTERFISTSDVAEGGKKAMGGCRKRQMLFARL